MKKSAKMALSGIFSALALVIMMLAGVIPVATIALPAVAGCLLIPIAAELGERWAYIAFFVVAVLSFFLTADREAFVIFTLFFGYYPILYSNLLKIKNKVLRYVLKLIIFNTAIVCDYLIATFVFGIPVENIPILGDYLLLVLAVLANIVFVVFDYALKGLIREYFVRIRPIISKIIYK